MADTAGGVQRRDGAAAQSMSGSEESESDNRQFASKFLPVPARVVMTRGGITTLAYGHAGKPKILSYDLQKLVNFGGLLTILAKGTILTVDNGILYKVAAQCTYAVLIILSCWFGMERSELESVDVQELEAVAKYLSSCVPFVLGLYVALCLSRWWALRVEALGTVFESVSNVTTLISCNLPGPRFAEVRTRAMKWSMASITLLVKAARGIDDIGELETQGLLLLDEIQTLKRVDKDVRAMVMWFWIMRLAQESFEHSVGPEPHAQILVNIWNECIAARNGIQTIHTYLKTQMPFAYVHLLTLLVDVNNLLICIKCSIVFAVALTTEDTRQMANQVLMMFLVPVLYQGLLSISYVISDPFGEDMLDFPIAAYTGYVAHACDAAVIAQDAFPTEWKEGIREEPPQELKQPQLSSSVDIQAVVMALGRFAQQLESLLTVGSQLKALTDTMAFTERQRLDDSEKFRSQLSGLLERVEVCIRAHAAAKQASGLSGQPMELVGDQRTIQGT